MSNETVQNANESNYHNESFFTFVSCATVPASAAEVGTVRAPARSGEAVESVELEAVSSLLVELAERASLVRTISDADALVSYVVDNAKSEETAQSLTYLVSGRVRASATLASSLGQSQRAETLRIIATYVAGLAVSMC